MPIIFRGDDKFAYRDPTCYYFGGLYHLFFTVSEKDGGYMYNRVGHSVSEDLLHFSEPRLITEKDRSKNYCSPGNVIPFGDGFLICVTSYPMPRPFAECPVADDTARLFFISTRDFREFSTPERIYPKGRERADEGRMIDPFVFYDGREYRLYFKQNGVSCSRSKDLSSWEYLGATDGGENACVIKDGGRYLLIHSPENGIGIKESEDLDTWRDVGTYTLGQDGWDFASGRLTAAFAMPLAHDLGHKYAVLFHGSRADAFPETHGNASLALAFTDDFKEYRF